jgi:hypothetical protein
VNFARALVAALIVVCVFCASPATPIPAIRGGAGNVGPIIGTPTNSAPPQISGAAQAGNNLAASPGTWTGSPSYTYQWFSATVSGGPYTTQLTPATSTTTYAVQPSDGSSYIVVQVVATNSAGPATAVSPEVGPAVGGAPINTALPQVSGTAQGGSTLTGTNGAWGNSPTDYGYQWYSDPDPTNLTLSQILAGAPTTIAGETTSTYVLEAEDVNNFLALGVTAGNALGQNLAVSNPVGPVTTQPVPGLVTGASLSGDLVGPGGILTTNPGAWTNNPTSYTYNYYRCPTVNCTSFTHITIGATTSTYTTVGTANDSCIASDIGCWIQVKVTAKNTGGTSAVSASAPYGQINLPTAPPVYSGGVNLPVISGAAQVGNPLTVSNGSWSNVPTSYSYQWYRGTTSPPTNAISGATTQTYTQQTGACPSGDQSCYIQAKVTASNVIGPSTPTASNTVGPVVFPPPPTIAANPTISGTLQGGQVLTASTGTWNNSPPTFAYAWYSGSTAAQAQAFAAAGGATGQISGATASTYTLQFTDTNAYIAVRVTASNAAGSASAPSAGVGPVAQPPPGISVNTVAPLINGQQLVGSGVCGTAGAWSSSPSSYWFRWYVSPTPGTDASPGAGVGTAQCWTITTIGSTNPLNQYLTLGVAAVNSAGVSSWTYYHSQTQIVASPANAPQTVFGYPAISGIPMATVTLSVDPGTWTNCGTSASPTCTYTFQWYKGTTPANATQITGATGTGYTIAAADVGSFINCLVTATTTASNPHPGLVATGTSVFTFQVLPTNVSHNTFLPHIIGGNQVGQAVYVSPGVWDNYPQSYTYQWFRDNTSTPITGPTWAKTAYSWTGGAFSGAIMTAGLPSNAYVLTSADVGHTIFAQVTAVNPGGNSSPATSQNYGNPPYPIVAAPVIANAANCNGWHNASPPGGGNDGCAGAPTYRANYTIQHPDFFTGYARQSAQTYGNTGSGSGTGGCKSFNGQNPAANSGTGGCHPNWAVAGVDYPVGVSTLGTGFAAPGTQTDPTLGYLESGTGWINGVSGQPCTRTAPCPGSVNYGFGNPGRCGPATNKQIQCPVGAVAFSSGNATWAAGVATYTMNSPFLVQPGNDVLFTVQSVPVYNGTWHVLSVSGNQFTVNMPVDPVTHSSSGNAVPAAITTSSIVGSATWSGGTATINLNQPMALQAGQPVDLYGLSPMAWNGTFLVASVTGAPNAVTAFTAVNRALDGQPAFPTNPGALVTPSSAVTGLAVTGSASPYSWIITPATPSSIYLGSSLNVNRVVTLSGFQPTGYNGSYIISSLDRTTITVLAGTNPGAITTQGAISIAGIAAAGIDIGPLDFSGAGNSTGYGYGMNIGSSVKGPCVIHDDYLLFDLGYSASGSGVTAYNIGGCSSVVVKNVTMRLRDQTYNPPVMDGLWNVLPSPPFDNIGSGPSFGIAYFLGASGGLSLPNGNIARPLSVAYSAFVNCPARCWSIGTLTANYNYFDGLNMYGLTPTTAGGHGDGWMLAAYDGPQAPNSGQVCNCDGINENEKFDTWLLPGYGGGGNTCFACGHIIAPSGVMTGSIVIGANQAKVTTVTMQYYNSTSQPQAFPGPGSTFANASGTWAYQLSPPPSIGSKIVQCYSGSSTGTFPDTTTPGCSGPQALSCTTAHPCTYDLNVTWNSPVAPTNVSFGSYNPASTKNSDLENNIFVGNITASTGTVSDSGCPTAGQFPCAGVDHAIGAVGTLSSTVINNYVDLCGTGPTAMQTGSTGGMTAGGQCQWAAGYFPPRGFGTTSFNPSGPNVSGGTPWSETAIQEGGNVMMSTGACISFWSTQASC